MNFTSHTEGAADKEAIRKQRLERALMRNKAKLARKSGHQQSSENSFSSRPHANYSSQMVAQAPATKKEKEPFSWPKFTLKNPIPKIELQVKGKMQILLGLFSLFLLFQLVFSRDGLVDFFKMDQLLADKQNNLSYISKEIVDIKHEIKLLQTSSSYQKKIVKDKLGVLSKDEYLVLFAREKVQIPN